MKPVRRTKSRTLPIAEPVPTATTSAAAATATQPPATPLVRTRAAQDVVPVSRARRGGQEAIDAGAVELGHVRTSSRRVRSAACAALRVAATVPVVIPSASPIAA